jgi:hypothetical protein
LDQRSYESEQDWRNSAHARKMNKDQGNIWKIGNLGLPQVAQLEYSSFSKRVAMRLAIESVVQPTRKFNRRE